MPKYTHNTRYTNKRLHPHSKRRMDCPVCDQWRTCRDTGKGWICEQCEHQAHVASVEIEELAEDFNISRRSFF